MPSLMTDHNVEGQFNPILRVLMSDDRRDFWLALVYEIESFESRSDSPAKPTCI